MNLFRVAIIGAATLKGKEVAEALQELNFPAAETKLMDDDESLGQLETVGDEVTFVQRVEAEQFRNVDFAFFASDAVFTGKHWLTATTAGATVVDLSYALEREPRTRIRAPWVESELGEIENSREDFAASIVVVAHPVATVMALLLARASRAGGIRTAAVTVFQPVSEYGKLGMDELHQQTVSLLSFQNLPKEVFDAQIAFNMISSYGDASRVPMAETERRILEHYKTIVGDRLPMPSMMLVQAPTFHAHTFSIYLELEREISVGDMEKALSGEHVDVTRTAEESPSNVNAAGQEDIMVRVRQDIQNRSAFWIWAAADNLKLSATLAVECALRLSLVRPTGRVQ